MTIPVGIGQAALRAIAAFRVFQADAGRYDEFEQAMAGLEDAMGRRLDALDELSRLGQGLDPEGYR